MRRIAVLDHNTHTLYVEDINEEVLEGQYGGDEEMYIEDNYSTDFYSWEWITGTEYIPEFNKDPVEINFEDLI